MQTTKILAAPRQGDINGFTGQFLFDSGTFKVGTAGVNGLFNLAFGLVDLLAGRRALFRGQLA